MATPDAHVPLIAPTHRLRDQLHAGRYDSPVGFAVGAAILACAGALLVSALVSILTDQRQTSELVGLGAMWVVVGSVLVHQCRVPPRFRSATAFLAMVGVWASFITVATISYLVLETFGFVDDAFFEAVSGFTTTASTVVPDPEALPRGVLFFRSSTQWIGGLGAIVFVVAVLPSIGVGGLGLDGPSGQNATATSIRNRRSTALVQRLILVYTALSGAGMLLFLVGGMGPFDAVTYAMTTISTGGFANHAGSFAHFRSSTVEWAGIGGMFLGGCNLAMLSRALRGQLRSSVVRSLEFRVYVSVIVCATIVALLTTAPSGGPTLESFRRSMFHVTSAVSTTGHHVGGWGTWDLGPQVLVLALIGVGAMSGSAGSGFRMVRALALFAFLRRELILQIHPRAVVAMRVGREVISESFVSRMIGYQAQYLLVAASGAIAIAAAGGELVTAMSASISAVANVGPALGDLVPGQGGALLLPRPARFAMTPLMLLGRLEIGPVFVGVMMAASGMKERFSDLDNRTARLPD